MKVEQNVQQVREQKKVVSETITSVGRKEKGGKDGKNSIESRNR